MTEWREVRLGDVCYYSSDKIDTSVLDVKSYISTENMLSNKAGIILSSGLPNIKQVSSFTFADVLVSNIRPYFKKIWYAKFNGGASNDILIFRSYENIYSKFLYYIISNDKFFDYSTITSKGTKMPRGDKVSIMNYKFLLPPIKTQERIAGILSALDDKIELNNKINQNLEAQAQALFKSWFVDFEPFGRKIPDDWKKYTLSDFLPVITGKKNANVSSSVGKYPFFSCSQSISWTDNYSFDGNAILVAGNGDFNVKFYNGKFEAYQRTYVLIPYNPKLTALLYYAINYNLSKITMAARGSVISFITKSNLEDFEIYAPINLDSLNIIKIFDTINNQILLNLKENQKLAEIRDALLPKLISGQIDVEKLNIN